MFFFLPLRSRRRAGESAELKELRAQPIECNKVQSIRNFFRLDECGFRLWPPATLKPMHIVQPHRDKLAPIFSELLVARTAFRHVQGVFLALQKIFDLAHRERRDPELRTVELDCLRSHRCSLWRLRLFLPHSPRLTRLLWALQFARAWRSGFLPLPATDDRTLSSAFHFPPTSGLCRRLADARSLSIRISRIFRLRRSSRQFYDAPCVCLCATPRSQLPGVFGRMETIDKRRGGPGKTLNPPPSETGRSMTW